MQIRVTVKTMQFSLEPNKRPDLKCTQKVTPRLPSGFKKTKRDPAQPVTFILEQAQRRRRRGKNKRRFTETR